MPFFVIATLESGKQEMRMNEHGSVALNEKRDADLIAERLGRFIRPGRQKRVDRKRVVDVKVREFKDKAECESYLSAANAKEMQ